MDEQQDPAKPSISRTANKLAGETSTYLLQHAYNCVNWYPWGKEAFDLAKFQDKPILLSIGYSACHWCHVMMHESFEDPDVAATMNRLFINIKVDKEERPDLDKIYQISHQLLMGRAGGWPLTMFLSPITLMPYYGGTYFPKDAMEGIPDFQALLHRLNDVYYHEKDKIKQQETHIQAIFQAISQPRVASELPLSQELRHDAEIVMQREFDPVNSGFGNEAKFPNCPTLEFIMQSEDPLIRHMTLTTLKHMAESGIYDQLAGGFFRYTVDPQWQIPHFEKMLYDNAQLLSLYAKAYNITHNELYKQIAIETGNWMQNALLDPSTGGFYTSLDADSDEHEGLYYLWDVAEIKELLTGDEYSSIKKYYNLHHKANFDDNWHLLINIDVNPPAPNNLAIIKQKLLQYRTKRTPPHLDNKILASNNGLAIQGLSIAGKLLNETKFLDMADNCIKFIRDKLFVDHQLFATWQNQQPKIGGFLDDYAFVLDGVLTFINSDPNHAYLPFCIDLADGLIENFYDTTDGGFYFSAHNAEKLFFNPKIFTDDATPSGNAIACIALLKLGKLTGNSRYIEIAKKSIYAAQTYLNDAPEVHLCLLKAYAMLHEKS